MDKQYLEEVDVRILHLIRKLTNLKNNVWPPENMASAAKQELCLRSGTIVFMLNMLLGECDPRFVTTEKSRPPRATDIVCGTRNHAPPPQPECCTKKFRPIMRDDTFLVLLD